MTPALLAGTPSVGSYFVESASHYTARRAHLEDLPALLQLWQQAGLPGEQLEKFLTEFQVVPGEEGVILAAIGLQITGDEALLHSEAVSRASEADACRTALWTRMQIVVRNQGVVRLWTLEDAGFWRGLFQVAQPAEITALKSPFADPTAAWYTLRLLDEVQMKKLVNEQMILRGGSLDEDRAEFAEKVRKVKLVAYSFAAAVIGLLLVFAFYLVVHRETLQRVVQGR